jgi:hypothetical protein
MYKLLSNYIREIGWHFLKDYINSTLNCNPDFINQYKIIYEFIPPYLVLHGVENIEIEDIF